MLWSSWPLQDRCNWLNAVVVSLPETWRSLLNKINILFSYLSHVGKCLGHGILTRGRFVLRKRTEKLLMLVKLDQLTFVYQYSAVLG